MTESTKPLWALPATDIAQGVAAGTFTARQVIESVLARISDVDDKVNAYALVAGDHARHSADTVDAAVTRGETMGPLAGVPFSVKDLVITKGVETAFGSHIFAGNIPDRDVVGVERLRRAGAVLIGKTTTPEFGSKALTSSPRHGFTRNPWNTDRSPGGSSGGSAVAVAAGMGPVSVTTDGAGSSRIPTAACGVLGLKPTLGRIPNESAIELFSSFVNLGFCTRTVADLAIGVSVMSGPSDLDPWSIGRPAAQLSPAPNPQASLKGLRVLTFRHMGNAMLDHDVQALMEQKLAYFASHGATIMDGPDDFDWDKTCQMTAMRAYQHARLHHLLDQHEDVMDPALVLALKEGKQQDLLAVQAAPAQRSELFRRVQGLFAQADVIVTPTVTAPPPHYTHGQDDPMTINNQLVGPIRANWYAYTGTFNHTGHPAISVPMGYTPDGLPAGLHIVGKWFDEQRLIDMAAAIEQDAPWADAWPDL